MNNTPAVMQMVSVVRFTNTKYNYFKKLLIFFFVFFFEALILSTDIQEKSSEEYLCQVR